MFDRNHRELNNIESRRPRVASTEGGGKLLIRLKGAMGDRRGVSQQRSATITAEADTANNTERKGKYF